MENIYSRPKHKSIPAVLLIFDHGLDALPIIVPNGGKDELDERMTELVHQRLLTHAQRKAAA